MLWARVMVNDTPVSIILARRRVDGGDGRPRVCTYDVSVEQAQRLDRYTIVHHYDDGALMLIWRILDTHLKAERS